MHGSVFERDWAAAPQILVVDDDALNREMLSAYLENDGHLVTTASSGADALRQVARRLPDVIFLDAMMPDMDGFEVCRVLKQNSETRLIPVVMITALSSLEDRMKGMEAGTDDFLTKPVNRLELLTRTRSLLRVKRYVDDLENAEQVVEALAKAIELRDGYTEQHTERVTARAVALGRDLGLTAGELDTLYQGGMLHDVGKIGTPESILGKPGKLTEEEFAVMREHPIRGVEICRPLRSRLVTLALPIIRHHHERVDGGGYPDGLKDDEIPLLARIIAISDAFDAMTTQRPYRQGMPPAAALDLLFQGAGTQWDRDLAIRFVEIERRAVRTVSPNDRLAAEGFAGL